MNTTRSEKLMQGKRKREDLSKLVSKQNGMEELNSSVLNGNSVKKGEEDSRVTILNIESLEIEKDFDQRLSFQMSPPKRDTVINLCKVAFQPVSTNHSEQFSKPTYLFSRK